MKPAPNNAAPVVAVSVSECPDMFALGMSEGRLKTATVDLAVWLLAEGLSLAYGGDLRKNGFTEILFELLGRYQGHPDHVHPVTVTNYLAWPVHAEMTADALAEFSAGHREAAGLVFLGPNNERLETGQWCALSVREPSPDGWEAGLAAMREKHAAGRELSQSEWETGLTAMRKMMRDETQARVVLGGKPDNYKGRMPGIAEEALLTLEAGQPLFLLGGFGGCTRSIAEVLGLVKPWAGSFPEWRGRAEFEKYTATDLRNGLSHEENAVLARTTYMEQAATLICRGLRKSHITNLH